MRSLSALSLSLMVATVSSTPLHAAAQNGDEDAMQKHLSTIINAADVDMPDERGLSPLMVACYKGNTAVAFMLLDHGASATMKDERGMTALHLAALSGHPDLARMLLDHGANVDAVEPSHDATALHLAASNANGCEFGGILLANGATADIEDAQGMTPANVAESIEGHPCVEIYGGKADETPKGEL